MEPELIAAGIMGAALTLYALLGGADFGAGVWEFNSTLAGGPTTVARREKERALIQRAVSPVWEANHVWLLFAMVIAHTAFPSAFRAVSQALWLPLLLALAGIVFRGAGFVLRAYSDDPEERSAWGAVFALSSTASPFFFGAAVGAVASGGLSFDGDGRFIGSPLTDWAQPLALFSGFFAVGVCAFLAAVYFTREARLVEDRELIELWRRRALLTGTVMGALAVLGLFVMAREAPALWHVLSAGWTLILLSVLAGSYALWSLHTRRFDAAIVGAMLAVIAVMVGWMLAQSPYLIPPVITLESAKGPDNVIWAAITVAAAGGVLLVPALVFLFRLFKSQPVEGARGTTGPRSDS